jgi:hypothetical protein
MLLTGRLPDVSMNLRPPSLEPIGKGLEALGQAIAYRDAERDNSDALNAYSMAAASRSELMYDPDRGIMTRVGSQALDGPERFQAETRRIGEEFGGPLSPGARRHFDRMWQRSNITDLEGVSRHTGAQVRVYRNEAAEATVQTAISTALLGHRQPGVLDRARSEVTGAIMTATAGMPEAARRTAVVSALSKLHRGIVEQMAPNNVFEAYEHFRANREEISITDYQAIVNKLRPLMHAARVEDEANRIVEGQEPATEIYRSMFPEIFGEGGETPPPSAAPDASTRTPAARNRRGQITEEALISLIPADMIPEGRTRQAFIALIQGESSLRPDAEARNPHLDRPGSWTMRAPGGQVGDGTAVGLTQVLVANARRISRELGDGLIPAGMAARDVIALLKDEAINVRYGAHMFSQTLARFNGDIEAALVDYNSGRGAQWLRAGRDYRVIPHGQRLHGNMTAREQTMGYVAGVMRNVRRRMSADRYPRTAATIADTPEPVDSEAATTTIQTMTPPAQRAFVTGLEPQLRVNMYRLITTMPQNILDMGIEFVPAPENADDSVQVVARGGQSRPGTIRVPGASPDQTPVGDLLGAAPTEAAPTGPAVVAEGIVADENVNAPVPADIAAWIAENAPASGLSFNRETRVLTQAPSRDVSTRRQTVTVTGEDGTDEVTIQTRTATAHSEQSLDAQLAVAQQIADPTTRADVIKALTQRHTLRQRADRENLNALKAEMWQQALQGQMPTEEQFAAVGLSYAEQIRRYIDLVQSGRQPQTDWQLWTNLNINTDTAALAAMDPYQHRGNLADREFVKLLKMVKDAREGGTGGSVRAETSSTAAILDRAARSLGVRNAPEQMSQLGQAFDAAIDGFMAQHSRNPTATEKQQIMDQLTIQTASGGLFSANTYAFSIQRGQTLAGSAVITRDEQVPTASRTHIATAFRSEHNLTVRPDQQRDIYGAYVIGERGGVAIAPAWANSLIRSYMQRRYNTTIADEQMNGFYTQYARALVTGR